MLILDRYLIAKYLKILGVATTALLSIYLTIDFVEQLRKYLKADTQLIDIIGYLGLKLPGSPMTTRLQPCERAALILGVSPLPFLSSHWR